MRQSSSESNSNCHLSQSIQNQFKQIRFVVLKGIIDKNQNETKKELKYLIQKYLNVNFKFSVNLEYFQIVSIDRSGRFVKNSNRVVVIEMSDGVRAFEFVQLLTKINDYHTFINDTVTFDLKSFNWNLIQTYSIVNILNDVFKIDLLLKGI
jgi:hypothetical protein